MAADDDIKNSIDHFLIEVNKKYKIQAAYLYGSYAKGRADKWSDIDVAIISPDFPDNLYETRLELMRMAVRIDDRLEPRPFKNNAFNANDPLASEVNTHGILLGIIGDSH
jgi:uncharacterized protein